MFLDNDITKYTTYESRVNSDDMVELPCFCETVRGEKLVLVSYNENSAQVIPMSEVIKTMTTLNTKLSQCKNEAEKREINDAIAAVYGAVIFKAEVIPMPTSCGTETMGIKLGCALRLLDKSDDGVRRVIFQNINGRLLMHYGNESFKKNVGECGEKRRQSSL